MHKVLLHQHPLPGFSHVPLSDLSSAQEEQGSRQKNIPLEPSAVISGPSSVPVCLGGGSLKFLQVLRGQDFSEPTLSLPSYSCAIASPSLQNETWVRVTTTTNTPVFPLIQPALAFFFFFF